MSGCSQCEWIENFHKPLSAGPREVSFLDDVGHLGGAVARRTFSQSPRPHIRKPGLDAAGVAQDRSDWSE